MKKVNLKHLLMTVVGIFIVCGGIYFLLSSRTSFTLNGEENITIALHSTYNEEGTNIQEAVIDGTVDTSQEGTYVLTYKYKNKELQRTIKVIDENRIVMNMNGSQETYVLKGRPYVESGCHAIDKKEGNLTNQIEVSGQVDNNRAGDYTITYSVTNQDGLTCQKERVVHVVEENEFMKNKAGVPVLMYHYVYTDQDVPEKLNVNYIKDTALEEHLKYLTENHYYFPSYQELEAYAKGQISLPQKSVVLTFDDGQKGFLKYGIPLLEKYKVPATSFIIASKDGEQKIKDYASEYVSFQSHSYDMHKAGGNIGHGGVISALKENEIVDDLKQAQTIVQNTEAFAYPYGDVTDTAKKAIEKAGILCSFTTQYGRVKEGSELTALPRVRVSGNNSLKAYIASIES